jgi:Phosphodiester glycosidase
MLAMASPAAAADLPLGPKSLDERRSVSRVAPGVRWTRIVRDGGPWRLNVLTVAAGARVLAVPASDRFGVRARPSALSRRLAAVAAVNGGYFDGDGYPVGALAAEGRLLSEPVGGRSALMVGAAPRSIGPLRFGGAVRVGEEELVLDGINRIPGEIPACGGRGGDRPTERPSAVTTCTDPSELVLFTPDWGVRTPRGRGFLDAVVRDGLVTALRAGGGSAVPPDAVVLTATGGERAPLREAGVGAALSLGQDLSIRSEVVPPGDIVSGGPRLLAGGRVRVRSSAEGFNPLSAPWFHGSFVASRQPRTMAGVRRDGSLLLVTVDGRRPGWSAGVTLKEGARVMRSLGARDALNLDGGGSTAMAVRGRAANLPSDPGGERSVSDAILVLP